MDSSFRKISVRRVKKEIYIKFLYRDLFNDKSFSSFSPMGNGKWKVETFRRCGKTFLSHFMLMIVDEMHSTTGQLNLLVPIGVAVACIERERAWQLAWFYYFWMKDVSNYTYTFQPVFIIVSHLDLSWHCFILDGIAISLNYRSCCFLLLLYCC